MGEKITSVFLAIVTVALVSVVVGSKNTASVFNSIGSAFANAISAAKG